MSTTARVQLVLRCAGCAATVDPVDPTNSPWKCPNAKRAPNVDHVLQWDPVASGVTQWPSDESLNPFIRYRTLQHSYWLGRVLGGTDADHVALVERLDQAIATTCAAAGMANPTGFRVTPFVPSEAASESLGVDVWVKRDTHSVTGSHKARHLMGLLLHLELRRVSSRTQLAIASCGNAALAAATLAKAARRPIEVYVPQPANPMVVAQLKSLSAQITECPRLPSDPAGDPCIHRFHEALHRGALPFCVQGPENGLTIDGGATMGHELADQLAMLGGAGGDVPDRLFVQVGGGALGTATIRGLRDAVALGVLDTLPKLHTVQSEGAAPLERAWRKVAMRALNSLGHSTLADEGDDAIAAALVDQSARAAVDEAFLHALTHRSQYMWPWEDEPISVATGILDDETYDWVSLVRAMITTGGWPIVATESALEKANALACSGPNPADADETGTASLAGAIMLQRNGLLSEDERIVALVTGIRRS
jgi:threonine synthase